MKNNFSYEITIQKTLKKADAATILAYMKAHPDTKKYTWQGHFGFAFDNYWQGQDVDRHWTFKELDIIMKSLEMPCGIMGEEFPLANKARLQKLILEWVQAIRDEYSRITGVLPNIYEGDLNNDRIKKIRALADNYNISIDTVRSLFNDGSDFYKNTLTK
tara:strand:+ start:6077 stop:6556 length:480 start_codon:yes stop_codon:yes gene_type:complete